MGVHGQIENVWHRLRFKSRFKRMRRVADLRIAPFGPDDRHHVKASRRLRNAVSAEIGLGGLVSWCCLAGLT